MNVLPQPKITILSLLIFLVTPASAQILSEKTEFRFGGYLKADFIHSWYTHGDVDENSPMRDIHLPGLIPVGERDLNYDLDFHVKESRFNFEVRNKILGKDIRAFVELDFLFSGQGNEKVTHSFAPRLRHFFFEWNNLLIGQTWSTFMIVTLPDEIDFTGAMDGIVIVRQPLIRYQWRNWWFALENPETTLTPYQEAQTRVSDAEILPDIIVRRNFSGKWGSWGIAGMVRTLHHKDSLSRKAVGYGLSTGGKIIMGPGGDDVRFMVTAGSGLGRYVAGNFIADAETNKFGNLNPNGSVNGYVAYNHFWIPKKLSSSVSFSAFRAFHQAQEVPMDFNRQSMSFSGNIKYNPAPNLRFGMEYMVGYRESENGLNGSFHRLQLAAKYNFGYHHANEDEKY